MKLKSLNKILCDVKFGVTVFRDKEYIESFTVDYLDRDKIDSGLLKLSEYEENGAEVRHISVNHVTGLNDIEIVIK